jgi:hypothetical protein
MTTPEMNPTARALEAAEARMTEARHLFSLATAACIGGKYDASEKVRDARSELDCALRLVRLALRELEASQAST